MASSPIDVDFVRRFSSYSDTPECEVCGLEWKECDEFKEKLKETPCSFVRRFFGEMTDEQRAWLAQAVEEKIKAERKSKQRKSKQRKGKETK